MLRTTFGACALIGCAVVASPTAAPAPAHAADELQVVADSNSRTFRLDSDTLRELQRRTHFILRDLPTGDGGAMTLDLSRFEPVTDDAIVTVAGQNPQPLRVPDSVAYLRGSVAGEQDSAALMILREGTLRGFVIRGGTLIRLVPSDEQDRTCSSAPVVHAWSASANASTLGNVVSLLEEILIQPVAATDATTDGSENLCAVSPLTQPGGGGGGTVTGRTGKLQAPIAIEITPDVVDLIGTQAAVQSYVMDLVAVGTVPYVTDAIHRPGGVSGQGVELLLGHLNIMTPNENRLCGGLIVGETRCSSATSRFCYNNNMCPSGEHCLTNSAEERAQCFADYWSVHFPIASFPRAAAVQMWRTNTPEGGGYGFGGQLCSNTGGYAWALTRITSTGALLPSDAPLFAFVFAHELGHVFGSSHANCPPYYRPDEVPPVPPVEVCRNNEPLCWPGGVADTPGGATIMSTFGCSAAHQPLVLFPRGQVVVPGVGPNPFPDYRIANTIREGAEGAIACIAEVPTSTPRPTATPTPTVSCCTAHSGPRCSNPSCELCVCDGPVIADHACCTMAWDGYCPDEAQQYCAPSCGCPTYTPTPTPCTGDCNGDGPVTIDELITMINIALGTTPLSGCSAGDKNRDGAVTVDEILTAVNKALNGCFGARSAAGSAAAVQGTVALQVGSASGAAGSAVTIPVAVQCGGGAVAGAQVDVLFDTSVLSAPTCSKDARLTNQSLYWSLPVNPPAPSGQARLRLIVLETEGSVLAPTIDTFTDGALLSCTFQIAATAAAGPYTLVGERSTVSDVSGNAIASVVTNGSLTVVPPAAGCSGCDCVPAPTWTPIPTPTVCCGCGAPVATLTRTPTARPTSTPTLSPTPTPQPTPASTPSPTVCSSCSDATPTPAPVSGCG